MSILRCSDFSSQRRCCSAKLGAHLRTTAPGTSREWRDDLLEAKFVDFMNKDEMSPEATAVYDNYVEALVDGQFEALQAYARNLSDASFARGRDDEGFEVCSCPRWLARLAVCQIPRLTSPSSTHLDALRPAAKPDANTAVGVRTERERIIRGATGGDSRSSRRRFCSSRRLLILAECGVDDPQTSSPDDRTVASGIRTNRSKSGRNRHHRRGCDGATVANHGANSRGLAALALRLSSPDFRPKHCSDQCEHGGRPGAR